MNRKQRRTTDKLSRSGQDAAIVSLKPYYELALHAQDLGDYVKAEQLWLDLLPRYEKAVGANDPDAIGSLGNLGVVYQKTGRNADAENCFLRTLVLRNQALEADHPDTATSLNNLAVLYKEMGRYSEAENFNKQALEIREKSLGPDHPDIASSLHNLASVYEVTCRYAEALNCYQRSLAIREKSLGPDHPDTASSLNNLGGVYKATGSFAEAEDYCQRSLAIREKSLGPTHQDTAASFNNIAGVYDATGRYAEAESYNQRGLLILEKSLGPDCPDTANGLNSLAAVYFHTARYAEAEIYLQRALAIFEQSLGPNNLQTAHCLHNLASIYQVTDRYTEAENCNLRAMAIKENSVGSDHPDTAATLINLAAVYSSTKRYSEAEKYYQQAMEIMEKKFGPNHPDTATSLNNLAAVYIKTDRYTEAENYAQRALVIWEKSLGPDHPNTATCLNMLAELYTYTGRLSAAILISKRSVNILQKVRQNVSAIGKEALFSFDKTIESNYDNLSGYLIKAGRYGEASFVMGMLKEKEQFELLRRDRQTDLANRTISYNDAEVPLATRFDELGSSLSNLGKQEDFLKQIKDRTPEQNQELVSVKEQLKQMNKEFSDFLDNLHEALPPREVSQIDQDSYKLINMTDADANTVAIFTVTSENSFHAVMITPHGRKAFSANHKAADIATKVLKFRELLKDPEDAAYLELSQLSQELYDIIIRPLEEELLSGGYTTILWMLNGVLRLLPLAALHDRDREQFVLEKFRNVCITTCSSIGQQPHESWNGLGMGVTREHEGHSPLPAVKEELEGIISMDNSTGIMPGDILLDEAFTRDSMESHLEAGYKVVHIASHFELNPANETMSYLLLGDGSKIRMDELRSIPRLFKGVDLVAFSACSTGLGTASTRGREVDGIGYLGEMQGARTVMATLWPVEDKSTSMLMREFYRLREEGMTTAEALRQAQLCLLTGTFTSEDGHNFTHPYFWAPFILIGNGG